MDFKRDMLPWRSQYYNIELELCQIFEKHSLLTLSEIKKILTTYNKQYDDNILNECLQNLLVRHGTIVKDEFWDSEPTYHYVEEYRQNSSYTKSYYSFNVDNNKNKKFLLISDTHIGNPEFEDFKMLQQIYERAISLGAKKCFHLGDVFNGSYQNYSDEGIEKQLNAFIENYPNPYKNEMMTYALTGNHDDWISGSINHLCKYHSAYQYDLRNLSNYNSSFCIFPRKKWQSNFQDIGVLFSHKLYINPITQEKRLGFLEEMKEEEQWMNLNYRVLISGHFHCGFIYSKHFSNINDEIIFIGVPSTSKININGIVAYIVSMNYDNGLPSDVEIIPLSCNKFYNIEQNEPIYWNFRKQNKVYCKKFNN